MNATTGNSSVSVKWDEPSTISSNSSTTVKYGDSAEPTVPIWTTQGTEIEVNGIEPLQIVMHGLFVVAAFILLAAILLKKMAATVRMMWGRTFEVDMRFGVGGMAGERPVGINERNVALRNLV